MILDTKTQDEFHPNGQLAFTQTFAILAPMWAHLYPNARRHPDGYSFLMVGRVAKYYDNGQLAWEFNYDEQGEIIKEKSIGPFRNDGTVITY